MKLRRVIQFLILAAVAACILLMRTDMVDRPIATEQEFEVLDGTPWPADAAVPAPVPTEAAPAPGATPAVTVFTPAIPGEPGEPPLVPAMALQTGVLPWEKRMNDVLDSRATSDADKARLLLEMLPTLPVEGRQTAAEYAVQRLDDDADYRFAQNVVTNPATYPPALAVLWADLTGRSDAVRLPVLLLVARNPSHPYAPYARENLDLLLGHDFGTDWPKWEAAIREKIGGK
ncbi:MAG: hypothetical protein ABMA13_02685 [Chthoniobacteraceae bacterium]